MADFSNIQYHVFEDYDIPFDEKGSTVGTVRKVQWVKIGVEPDPEKAKLEIRHVTIKEEGEIMGKGYSFSTPEGPNELVHGLIKIGYGDTKEILREVRRREDFLEAAKTINEDPDEGDGEVFDMRDLLIGMDDDEVA